VSEELGPLSVETTGETVGEAKWAALRELERMQPGLDKASVGFQVVTEGERGLLGVGYEPARVVATASRVLVEQRDPPRPSGETDLAGEARELVERVATAIGLECRVEVAETDEQIVVTCEGGDLGMLIGRHGQTIDAVQYLANSIGWRRFEDSRKEIVVDAAGYRERRRTTLEAMAVRSAERALELGEPVDLEPMTAVERKVVHQRLQDFGGVETSSEGAEPNRYVVVHPAATSGLSA
jgi:spoIIIJ-associated protein